jgi:hypothetical protein
LALADVADVAGDERTESAQARGPARAEPRNLRSPVDSVRVRNPHSTSV